MNSLYQLFIFVCGLFAGAVGLMLYLIFGGVFHRPPQPRRSTSKASFAVTINNQRIEGVEKMELKEGQRVPLQIVLKTRRGNAATVEAGSGRWSSSDESVVTVTPDPADELKAIAEGVDGSANESVTIEFRADADKGEGVREIVAAVTITCTQGDAFVAEIEPGTVEDVPADSPGNEPTAGETQEPGTGEDEGGDTAGEPDTETES